MAELLGTSVAARLQEAGSNPAHPQYLFLAHCVSSPRWMVQTGNLNELLDSALLPFTSNPSFPLTLTVRAEVENKAISYCSLQTK
jgi:hypothetical protein